MICIEVQIQSSSQPQQNELKNRIIALVQGNGFTVDVATYTPEAGTLAELAAVAQSRASLKIYEV